MLDGSLITTGHLLTFLIVFAGLAAGLSYRVRRKRQYGGTLILTVVVLAALIYVPTGLARVGFLLAALIVAIIGTVDESLRLRPIWQLVWQICIASILAGSGWIIPYVSNPLAEGVIDLQWVVFMGIAFPGALLAVFWIVLMMNAVNWLDGADGLAGGVTLVSFSALAAVAMLPSIYNTVGLGLALVGAAGILAFFIWNFPPAKLYLGTVGSWFIGMYLALAAMQGGGKIATTLLILALPVFDVLVVIIRRLIARRPIWQGDTVSHIHHRLQQGGISNRQIVLAAMAITAALASMSILLTTKAKLLVALVGLAGIAVVGLRLSMSQRMLKRSRNYETANALPRR